MLYRAFKKLLEKLTFIKTEMKKITITEYMIKLNQANGIKAKKIWCGTYTRDFPQSKLFKFIKTIN